MRIHHAGCAVNKRELDKFKKMLQAERMVIVRKATKTLAEEAVFDTDDLPDDMDKASTEYTQSLTFRLRDREKFLLSKIEKALKRIDDGEFGVCESCGEDISLKRLEARPVTTLCIKCKEEQEKREKSFEV
jgi:DnaK suppressor protein